MDKLCLQPEEFSNDLYDRILKFFPSLHNLPGTTISHSFSKLLGKVNQVQQVEQDETNNKKPPACTLFSGIPNSNQSLPSRNQAFVQKHLTVHSLPHSVTGLGNILKIAQPTNFIIASTNIVKKYS